MPQVRATARAQQQIAALNRRDRPQFDAFVIDVGRHGCSALAYRLSGATPINHVLAQQVPLRPHRYLRFLGD